mgnify:CR=1 FL=1
MNILVVNGSPKGQNSITLQTTNYLKISAKGSADLINKIVKVRVLEAAYPISKGEII